MNAESSDKQETPRTDAHCAEIGGDDGLCYSEFARQLERELDKSVEDGARLVEDIDGYKQEIAKAHRHIQSMEKIIERAEKAEAALSARVETMDTAPKDGTPILGFVPSYYEGKGAWVVVLWLGKKGMRDAGWMDNRAWKVEPQCWMPLPAIPSYVKDSDGKA